MSSIMSHLISLLYHDDTGYSIDNDDTLTITVSDLVSNDTDADGDALTITSVSNPVGGTVELVTPASVATSDPTLITWATPGPEGAAICQRMADMCWFRTLVIMVLVHIFYGKICLRVRWSR